MVEDLSRPDVEVFLKEHLRHMVQVTPPGCVHALDLEALKKPEITFWTIREAGQLLCCGALKKLTSTEVELKSMRTAPEVLGRGFASQLLKHLILDAQKDRYQRIYLETGSYEAFEPARKLYEKFGFIYCDPFADYQASVNSVYMVLQLSGVDFTDY